MQCVGTDEENVEFLIHFEDILAFTTGAPREPPLGYDPPLQLNFFSTQPVTMYPKANTCSNTLYLPRALSSMNLEKFSYYILSGILNSIGFGQV